MKLADAIHVNSSYTGGGAARAILDAREIRGVLVAATMSTVNEYDPRRRIIYLSLRNFYRSTAQAVATGAHEAGHALQHASRYWPFMVRMKLFTPCKAIAFALPVLLLVAIVFEFRILLVIVISTYAALVAFHLLTIPIEADASTRAHYMLIRTGMVEFGSKESQAIQRILRSFLWNYIFAFVLAPLHLILALRHTTKRTKARNASH